MFVYLYCLSISRQSPRPARQKYLSVTRPVPEQAARRTCSEFSVEVGFKCLQPLPEQMRRSERNGQVAGKYAIKVLDDVSATSTEDSSSPAESCTSERILISILMS